MADTDFYNRNLYRNYPFTESPGDLPALVARELVADVTVVFFDGSEFDPEDATHLVYPHQLGQDIGDGNRIKLVLSIQASGTTLHDTLIFADFGVDPSDYAVAHFTFPGASVGRQQGFGFAVLGRSDITQNLTGTESIPASFPGVTPTASDAYLEQRCVQVMKGHYIRKIDIVNEPRTTAPNLCLSSSGLSAPFVFAPRGQDIVGDVRFREGYNCSINVVASANGIRFAGRRGAGQGEACTEIARTEGEELLLAQGKSLDRAVRCDEVFSHFNGVQPGPSGDMAIRAGKGVIVDSPASHTVRIAGRDSMEAC